MGQGMNDALRAHWDARYATPGRVPLTAPSPGFAEWIGAHDDDSPVLLIGDGEGRHVNAVPRRHPVTMVELSPVGAARCRELATRPVEVVVADAFTWLRATGHRWPLVAMLYLQALDRDEEAVLVEVLRAAVASGGGFLLEFARAGLPVDQERRLGPALGVRAVDVSRGGVERIRLAR